MEASNWRGPELRDGATRVIRHPRLTPRLLPLHVVESAHTAELEGFTDSAQRVVDYLNDRTPLTDWSVSRITGEEQVHLHVSGDRLLHVGDRVRWEETFCRRMLGGASPVVRDATLDPDYADLVHASGVRAYAGAPILDGEGDVFGTICGASAAPLAPAATVDDDLRELLGVFSHLLSRQLVLVHSAASHQHSARAAEMLAGSDPLTGLLNRRGWDLVVEEAQERVDGLGDPMAVLMVDLDDLKRVNDTDGHRAGDALIAAAAAALRTAAVDGARIARYGGDEFAVIVEGGAAVDPEAVVRRYTDALAAAGVSASVGAAPVLVGAPGTALERALSEADVAMYAVKLRRRADRTDRADRTGAAAPR